MNHFSFIVNPLAGKGSARRLLEPLAHMARDARLSYEILLTEHAGHATALARSAAGETIVAVGGDGTLNEIANGIAGTRKTLGIVPAGSGNDFIKAIGVPVKLTESFQVLLRRKTVAVDLARVRCSPGNSGKPEERYFINGVGIGFDAAVAARVGEIRFLRGTALYLLAVFQTLGRYRAPDFTVDLDGLKRSGHNLLIAIGNGTCAGGGFYLTPGASPTDGKLDVCMIDDIGVGTIVRVIPKALRGKHIKEKPVTMFSVRRIHVNSSDSFFVHADGEILGRIVKDVQVEIIPGILPVIVG